MGAIFKVDLKRAFLSRGFLIAILGGCILCVWQFAERIPSMLFIMKQVVSEIQGMIRPMCFMAVGLARRAEMSRTITFF